MDSEFVVRVEQPLTLSESEPEPDIAIVRGTRGDFRHRHPGFAQRVRKRANLHGRAASDA